MIPERFCISGRVADYTDKWTAESTNGRSAGDGGLLWLEITHVPDPLTFSNFVHLYSGEAGFLGDANRANVLRRDLQDDASRLRGAAKIFGHEVDGTTGESPSSPWKKDPIRDIDLRRITKKLQVRFDKTDQLMVTAIEDTEGATRAEGAPLAVVPHL